MLEDAMDWLNDLDREDQTSEVFRCESEYMRQKLQSEDEANRLHLESLESLD